jgi:hypothetical protein
MAEQPGSIMLTKACSCSCLALLVLLPAARAQYPYPYPVYPQYGPGGYLQGSAAVINAQGNYASQMEQARILREQANQAKLDTKRKTFDEMQYEKANTPTQLEVMAQTELNKVKRIMLKPLDGEVTSGSAHNIMLPYLRTLTSHGIQGPPTKLSEEQLKQINVTIAGKGSLTGLKNVKDVDWPAALQGPTQKKVAEMLDQAVAQAAKGKLDTKLFRLLQAEISNLRAELSDQFKQEKIDGYTYISGKRFLEPLESGIQALGQPGAAKFLDGTYAAKGNTVQELVDNMSQNGLVFAQATPGNEPAYYGVLNAMVAYANGAQGAAAFQAQGPPPRR